MFQVVRTGRLKFIRARADVPFVASSNARIKKYSEMLGEMAPRLGAFDRVYYDDADNRS